jgi:hypothetical protein
VSDRRFRRLAGWRPTALALALALALAVAWTAAAARAATFAPCPPDLSFDVLARHLSQLAPLADLARRHRATFGVYGGTVRDLFYRRPFSPISDVDLVYDSSEPGFPALRDGILELARRNKGRMPTPDFHFDLSTRVRPTARQELFHTEGITLTKVGVLCDGRVIDPTGKGVADLRARVVRFHSPRPRRILELANLGRFVRDVVRLPGFQRDPATMALLARSLAHHAGAGTASGRRARRIARRLRSVARAAGSDLVSFPALIRDFRNDVRQLHEGRLDRLSRLYPMDLFVFDLFKSVTQADRMEAVRETFSTLGVDRFLIAVGLAPEAAVLMDPALDRTAVYRRFQFPGHRSPSGAGGDAARSGRAPGNLARWEATLRRYTYRVLFDMLASELPDGSPERAYLAERKADFLEPGTYATLSPGDDFGETILGFLATDFAIGKLDRSSTERSLRWFVSTYLPHGDVTLRRLARRRRAGARRTPRLESGWSPEVSAIPRDAPHGMADLDGYLRRLVGEELVPLYRDPGTSVAFLACDRDEAVRLVAGLSFVSVHLVNAAGLSRRRGTLLAHDPRTDRVCLAEFGFHSDDQLLNHQARIWFLGRASPPEAGPQSVRPPPQTSESARFARVSESARFARVRVHVLRPGPGFDFPGRRELAGWLARRGRRRPAPSVLFIGFVNPLRKLLARTETLAIGELRLMTGRLGEREVIALSAFGAAHGTLPGEIVRLLAPRGLEHVVFVGTGGGIAAAVRRHEWVVPARTMYAGAAPQAPPRPPGAPGPTPASNGVPVAFDNRAAGLGLAAGAAAGALHASVPSPLVETRERVRQLAASGVASVDCELHHVVRAIAPYRDHLALWALINVTDFPEASEASLHDRDAADRKSPASATGGITGENDPGQRRRIEEAFALIVRALARDERPRSGR